MQSGQLDSQRNAQIASLGIERTTLSRKVDNWNNGMLFALGLTVLAAFVVFWTTRMTNLRSTQLTAVQDRLNTLNDEQAIHNTSPHSHLGWAGGPPTRPFWVGGWPTHLHPPRALGGWPTHKTFWVPHSYAFFADEWDSRVPRRVAHPQTHSEWRVAHPQDHSGCPIHTRFCGWVG